MKTNASYVRSMLVAAAVAAAACAGPSTSPPSKPQPGGSGGSTGTGGAGDSTGGNGTTPTPTPTPTPDGGTTATDGGTTAAGIGCSSYVTCLGAAMSAADATACDNKASANAKNILDAEDTCVLNFCLGMAGGTVRCKTATDGSPENLDGSPAFDATTNAPTGDCGVCLLNGEAGLFGQACQPTTDPACNTAACTQQVAACHADG
jgi:hypothetical protein